MFLSSSSCLLGLFRSLTASNSFLSLRGSVPVTMQSRHTMALNHTLWQSRGVHKYHILYSTLWTTLWITVRLFYAPEMTDSFQPSRSMGRPEVLEKHWSSRTFSLFSSASFLGQSDPPPPAQPPPREDMCWFSELQERERRPSEHHSLGGEPCSHPSCTLGGVGG